jgi:iron(III) transport system ATP-binding protein
MTSIIELHDITKQFDDVEAVNRVSLDVTEGEIMVLLGPSGCGKTTLLRLIAGLETPDAGEVRLNGRVVAGRTTWVEPEARRVGFVFQDYALFPHLSVAENIVFGLRGWARDDRSIRIKELLALVGLPGLGSRMPHELSGGQQQRVALARALAPRPDVMLLDEPFSNLDAARRTQMRHDIREILLDAGVTTVFVTHDQEEALSLSDRVAVMFDGVIVQVGQPRQIYLHPNSPEVAAFVGEANFLPAQANGLQAECVLGSLPLSSSAVGPVTLMIRPESLWLSSNSDGVPATVTRVEFFGHDQRIHLRLDSGERLSARTDLQTGFSRGQTVAVSLRQPVMAFADMREVS